MSVFTEHIRARAHGGPYKFGRPTLIVVHDVESPLKRGYARSLAINWFAAAASTSANAIIDPGACIEMVPDGYVSWNCGPHANAFTYGIEQTGYASFAEADWITPDGLSQMRVLAGLIAEKASQWDIPLRWATPAQIRAAAAGNPGGICTHKDIRDVLAGTTHWDPGYHYPQQRLLGYALEAAAGNVPTPRPPTALEMGSTMAFVMTVDPDEGKSAHVLVTGDRGVGLQDGKSSTAIRNSLRDPSKLALVTRRDFERITAVLQAEDE